jgi:hypothetical protein
MDANPKIDDFDDVAGQNFTNRLIANKLLFRQGVAQSVEANEATLRQVAAGVIRTDNLSAESSAAGLVHTKTAELSNSSTGVVAAGGDADMDQSGSVVVVAGGNVTMDQSGSVVLVTNTATVKNSMTVVLVAQKVDGDVTTLFNTRDAVIFGAVAGMVGGLLLLISRMFSRK